MTRDPPVATEEELADELAALLARAHDGGVDVRGAWECLDGVERPDWEVVVTELAPPE